MRKFILGTIFGIMLCGGIVYGALYKAEDISYINSESNVKNVSEALNNLYKEINNGVVALSYSGGGYMRKDQKASSSAVVFNDNYKKIKVTYGTASIVFNYSDGTTSSAVLVETGDSLQIPENVESISCSSNSDSIAGDDGYGGQWLSGTATIQLEK